MNKRFITGLFCALAGGAQAADDPMVEYRQACEAPHYEALSVLTHPTDDTPVDWDAAARPCRAFLQRLEEAEPEDPLARFALYRAKSWLDGHQGDPCAEVAEIVDSLPDNADALFEWWVLCDDDDSLLKQTVRAGHPHARDMLLSDVVHQGNYYGFPAETLARYAEEAYQDALYVTDRYHAARAIYEIALDTGDTAAAKAIQDRMVHDLGLAYDPAHRGQSLERMCGRWMFNMDLEGRLCVPALEALAAEALARGEAIPDDVLLHLGTAFGEAEHKAFLAGGETDAVEALAAILAAHPEPLRSSEHLRVLAAAATPWASPERAEALRRAVETDPGNPRARCDLAAALGLTGAVTEAEAIYRGVMAVENAPCNAEEGLRRLADRREGEMVYLP